MIFLPKSAVLSIEEMGELAARFVARGIRRIRLTGGEPLVRRGIDILAMRLGALIGHGLDELTLTTNAMRLAAGQADAADAARDEPRRQLAHLLDAEHRRFGQENHVFRHAVTAAQVAAVGNRQAQVADPPAKSVDQGCRRRGVVR